MAGSPVDCAPLQSASFARAEARDGECAGRRPTPPRSSAMTWESGALTSACRFGVASIRIKSLILICVYQHTGLDHANTYALQYKACLRNGESPQEEK